MLPIAALASTGDCCYRSDEGAETLRSKHSDTNSTVSVVDECEVSNCSLWASTEAIAHQKSLCSRDYIRPVSVPIIELNRISFLEEEWYEEDPPEQNQEGIVVNVHYE